MNAIFISSLLGAAAFVLQVSASEETLKVSVSVWPPGSHIYPGECVLLQCTVGSNSTFMWNYRWFRHNRAAATPNPRHLVSSNSYYITAVTREDAGGYRCQAERQESNATSVVLLSPLTTLSVSELPPPSLTLTPSTTQVFGGERFTLQCPASRSNSSGWTLRQFSPARRTRKGVLYTDQCSPLGGVVSAEKSDACAFTAASGNSGLYWCEGAEGRSNAVNITVSYGTVLLRAPAFPVFEGDDVILCCRYRTSGRGETAFFRNGAEIMRHNSSSSDRATRMTIEHVTRDDEGLYKCASQDRRMESPESWLSVRPARGNLTSADGTAAPSGLWKWMVSCGFLLLLLVPLTVWLVCHHRYHSQAFCSCWPVPKEDQPAVELPATKQDTTEVQWDLSWMEMSSLLDKQLCPGT